MTKVTDEMLMAFADGELDEETAADVARAVATDRVLAGRLERFRQTRLLSKQAFAGVLEEPVPQRLLDAASRGPSPLNRPWSWRSWMLPSAIAVAASVAGFLIALSVVTSRLAPLPLLPGEAQLGTALDEIPSGDMARLDGGISVEPTASYVVGDEVCRTFRVRSAAETAWLGIACRHAGTWQVEMAVADRAPDGGFVTASDQAGESIDAFLESLGASDRLGAEDEQRVREEGWRPLP